MHALEKFKIILKNAKTLKVESSYLENNRTYCIRNRNTTCTELQVVDVSKQNAIVTTQKFVGTVFVILPTNIFILE